MTDPELRALIEHHAEKLCVLNVEPQSGYGIPKKDAIIKTIDRMKELAKELE